MNFTLDELKRFQQNGTLESMILSHGLLPMQVLEIVLGDVSYDLDEIESLKAKCSSLEEDIMDLEEELSSLEEELVECDCN